MCIATTLNLTVGENGEGVVLEGRGWRIIMRTPMRRRWCIC